MKTATSLILLCALSAITPELVAQEKRTDVEFKTIVMGSTLVPMGVMDESGKPIGHVAELMIDHRNGYLALFGVQRTDAFDGELMLVPPIRMKYVAAKGYLQLTQPLDTFRSKLTCRVDAIDQSKMRAIYKESRLEPYWTTRYGLVSLDDLDGRIVRGTGWKKVGRIKDVAFAPELKWKVAYVVLEESDDPENRMMAVPLGAFNRPKFSTSWTIPASADTLKGMPKFKGEWPKRISRDWVEMAAMKGQQDDGSGGKKTDR
jgi:sporulation protein YlmC with PRC-barrel domain